MEALCLLPPFPGPGRPLDRGTPRRGYGHRGVALAVLLCAQLMVILDATVVNIALPEIQHGLHFSATSLSWVLNGYTLTFGGLLLLGGRAGDILGRRRMFLIGVGLFTLASLAGGLATSSGLLLAARAVQGIGGALASPAVLALMVGSFPEGRERTRALAIYTGVITGGASLGLVLGGVITEWLSWRWVLFINVPIGLIALAAAPRFVAETPRQPGRFDLAGALTSTLGMVFAGLRVHPGRRQRMGRRARGHRVRAWRRCCWPPSCSSSAGHRSRSPRCACSPTSAGPGPTWPGCCWWPGCSGCSSS